MLKKPQSRIVASICALLVSMTFSAVAGPEEDWQKLIALDAGPQQKFKSREEALQVTVQFLATQEKVYRGFLLQYPNNPHALDVKLRMAHLLAVKADLQSEPSFRREAKALLEKMIADPALPEERKSDVHYAQISLFMRSFRAGEEKDGEELLRKVRAFETDFPGDRRTAPLLVEIATLFDAQPSDKAALLKDALALTKDDDLKHRINDDLLRISLLGKAIELNATATDGSKVSLGKWTGQPTVVCFFATWSPPSMEAVQGLTKWANGQCDLVGISLDNDVAALAAELKKDGVSWPVVCDGKSWTGKTVRAWGINALPTIWVLDPAGRLRTLNLEWKEVPDFVRALAREH